MYRLKLPSVFVLIVSSFTSFGQAQTQHILDAKSGNFNNPPEKAMLLYNKGIDYFNAKQYSQAVKMYEQALAVDSNYIDAYNNLGLTFYEDGKQDSAEHYILISLSKVPNGLTALQNLGLVEEAKNNYDKAMECYKAISTQNPNGPEGFYNAARVYTTLAKFDEALQQAQTAEKLYNSTKNPYISDCHYLLLVIYFNMHNVAKAKEYMALCKKEGVQVDKEIEAGLK